MGWDPPAVNTYKLNSDGTDRGNSGPAAVVELFAIAHTSGQRATAETLEKRQA